MKRLIILGVDGACFDVIGPWMKKGALPGFSMLAESGCLADLCSSTPPLSPVAWTSMVTGVNPGKHGIYDFWLRHWPDEEQLPSFNFATGRDRKAKAFWEYLSEAGRPSMVFNMPCTYPPDPINGLMISGFDAALDKAKGFHPPSLFDEITSEFGEYYQGPLDLISRGDIDKRGEALKDAFVTMAKQKREIYLHLLKNRPWDVFFGVFTESDSAMHAFFDTVSSTDHEQQAIYLVFKEIDEFIQQVLSEFGNDVDFMVVSDHGFTTLDTGIELNTLLDGDGLLQRRYAMRGRLMFALKQRLKWLRPIVMRMKQRRVLPESKAFSIKPWQMDVDFENSRVFFNGVYPYFHVLPGEDPGEVFDEVRKCLLSLTYEDRPVFRDVMRPSDLFEGPCVEGMPEIIGLLHDHFEAGRFGKTGMPGQRGRNDIFTPHVWQGLHAQNGLFMFRGETCSEAGSRLSEQSIFDIAPTVLAHAGLPVPKGMDGNPIPEVLNGREINETDDSIYRDSSSEEMGEDDEKAMAERLDALGYL